MKAVRNLAFLLLVAAGTFGASRSVAAASCEGYGVGNHMSITCNDANEDLCYSDEEVLGQMFGMCQDFCGSNYYIANFSHLGCTAQCTCTWPG